MNRPLMPKATAVWLVDNTSLSFEQIGEFCGLHTLEIKGIADGDVAVGIQGHDPIASGQLTADEIQRCSEHPTAKLRLSAQHAAVRQAQQNRSGARYTPLSKRQDRPNAIAWLLRHHPELADSQLTKLVGTTKPTIQSIRDRSHWNMPNIKAQDPVTLGLCSQTDLDMAVTRASERVERARAKRDRETQAAKAEQIANAEAAGMPSMQPPDDGLAALADDAPQPEPQPAMPPAPQPEVQPEPEPELTAETLFQSDTNENGDRDSDGDGSENKQP